MKQMIKSISENGVLALPLVRQVDELVLFF